MHARAFKGILRHFVDRVCGTVVYEEFSANDFRIAFVQIESASIPLLTRAYAAAAIWSQEIRQQHKNPVFPRFLFCCGVGH